MKRLPPIEELRRLFDYDPETGVVTRKVTVQGKAKKGDVAGCKHSSGYLIVRVTSSDNGSQPFKLHRICYALYHGRDPYPMEVDHMNHDRADNRICNLRLVTGKENHKNLSIYKHNASGFHGVNWNEKSKKWHSRIRIGGKDKRLGSFTNKADAIAARKAAEIKYGFHKNHGHDNDAPEQEPPVEISDEVRQLSLRLIQPVDDESTPQKQSQECRA